MAVKDLQSSRSSITYSIAPPLMAVTVMVLLSPWPNLSLAQFIPPPNVSCACLRETLTYNCTVQGGEATIWNGSAFSCAQREITLLHNTLRDPGECNNGAIVGQIIERDDSEQLFTSQLTVNVSSELNLSTIRCIGSAGSVFTPVGNPSVITIRSGPYLVLPTVRLTNANANTLRFTWLSVDSTCPSLSYEMTTSDSGCGTCSIATNTTTGTATCTGLQLGSVCRFSVQSSICGFTGMPSNTVAVAIRVPDQPQVSIIPVYSADTNNLDRVRVSVDQKGVNNVTDLLFRAVTEYTTSYSGGMQRNTSCMDDQCEYEISGPFQDCATSTSSTTIFTVLASNVFGPGEASMPRAIDCGNRFVSVEYVAASSVIICNFLDVTDTSVKSCTVMYGQCGQALEQKAKGNSTAEVPNSITLQLNSSASFNCYSVTANNSIMTVIVDGRITKTNISDSTLIIIIAVVVTFLLLVTIIVTIIAIGIVASKKWRQRASPTTTDAMQDLKNEEDVHNPMVVGHLPQDKKKRFSIM